MEESKCDYIITPKEINTQKHDLFISYRSNSQSHFQDIAPFNYEHRIRLNPFGESKNMDIRYHIPTTHIKDSLVKSAYSSPKKNNKPTAYEQAEIELNINSQTFYVPSKFFNPNESSTYESISQKEVPYPYSDVKSGFNSKDILKINNSEKEINFILGTINNKENDLGNIGLSIPRIGQNNVYPFFDSLKKAELINSYTFTLKYLNSISIMDSLFNYEKLRKPIGQFIIGDEPHNYESDKNFYNESEYIKVNALYDFDGFHWDFYFDSIYYQLKNNTKVEISGNRLSEINPDIGFIISTSIYFNEIKQQFFNKYKGICKEKTMVVNRYTTYIECDKSDNFTIESFPNLYFEHKGLETIFNLTYEDLFILDKTTNKYIFLILNSRLADDWILGTVFLRKYQLTFNVDSKTIGYYKSMNTYKRDDIDIDIDDDSNDKADKKEKEKEKEKEKDNGKEEEDEKEKNNESDNKNGFGTWTYIILGILLLIFCIIFLFIGMLIQNKFMKNRRKKRFNELEDENNNFYDEEKNNNLIDNPNKKQSKDKNKDEYDKSDYNIN